MKLYAREKTTIIKKINIYNIAKNKTIAVERFLYLQRTRAALT